MTTATPRQDFEVSKRLRRAFGAGKRAGDGPATGQTRFHTAPDRIETHPHTVYHDVDRLFSDRRHPGEPRCLCLVMLDLLRGETGRHRLP